MLCLGYLVGGECDADERQCDILVWNAGPNPPDRVLVAGTAWAKTVLLHLEAGVLPEAAASCTGVK